MEIPQIDKNLEEQIAGTHERIRNLLLNQEIPSEQIAEQYIRLPSVLYMVYWFHRLRNNPQEQVRIKEHLVEYIGPSTENSKKRWQKLFCLTNLFFVVQKNMLNPF